MRRVFVVLLGLTLLLPVSAATATAQKPPRYKAYVICSDRMSAPPATVCADHSPKTAVFLSKDRDVVFKICLRFPDRSRLCAKGQFASEGVKRINHLISDGPGRYKVTWRSGGERIASYVFRVHD